MLCRCVACDDVCVLCGCVACDDVAVLCRFEEFLKLKWPSEKRFGLEGCEVSVNKYRYTVYSCRYRLEKCCI